MFTKLIKMKAHSLGVAPACALAPLRVLTGSARAAGKGRMRPSPNKWSL